MKKSILKSLVKKCREELPNHPEHKNFSHWSFLFQDGVLISDAINSKGEPPKYVGYHREGDTTYRPKLHSEFKAIQKTWRKLDGFTCVNVRLGRSGEMRMSAPCKICSLLLEANNCKRVFFSTPNGFARMDY